MEIVMLISFIVITVPLVTRQFFIRHADVLLYVVSLYMVPSKTYW